MIVRLLTVAVNYVPKVPARIYITAKRVETDSDSCGEPQFQ